jgi:hypothetical protein
MVPSGTLYLDMTGSDELVGQLGRHRADHAGVEERDVGQKYNRSMKYPLSLRTWI